MTRAIRPARLLAAFLLLAFLAPAAHADYRNDLAIESPALGRKLKYALYLPAEKSGTLPVLFLLHGLGGNERNWEEMGRISETADRLIAEGALPPLGIVMPDGGDSWYVNSQKHGNYENALLRDLVPETEARHDLGKSRNRRAVAGLSMGGYGAFRLAFRVPDRFLLTAGLSAAIFPDLATDMDVTDQQLGFFKGAFGTPFEVARFNRENFFSGIPGLTAQKRRPHIYITVGDDDGFGLYRGNIALYLALREAQVPVEFRMTDGDHSWQLWRQEIETVLRYYGRLLRTEAD